MSSVFNANVAEAGDIVLYVMVLAITLVVGLVLLGIDLVVAWLRGLAARRRTVD